jgi:hypothetical protein
VDLWTFIWLMFLLKIPICGLLWIVWWAIRQTDEQSTGGEDGGSKVHSHRRPLPRPPRPRRGTHASPPPPSPARVRCSMARTLAVGCPAADLRPARRETSRLGSTNSGHRGGSTLNG